jgi:hypothetical protein
MQEDSLSEELAGAARLRGANGDHATQGEHPQRAHGGNYAERQQK